MPCPLSSPPDNHRHVRWGRSSPTEGDPVTTSDLNSPRQHSDALLLHHTRLHIHWVIKSVCWGLTGSHFGSGAGVGWQFNLQLPHNERLHINEKLKSYCAQEDTYILGYNKLFLILKNKICRWEIKHTDCEKNTANAASKIWIWPEAVDLRTLT